MQSRARVEHDKRGSGKSHYNFVEPRNGQIKFSNALGNNSFLTTDEKLLYFVTNSKSVIFK